MIQVYGEYSKTHYTIYRQEPGGKAEELYQAGNSPHCSQTYLDAEDGVGLDEMRNYCEITAKMMAEESDAKFGGVFAGEEMAA